MHSLEYICEPAHPVDQEAKLHRVFCFRLSGRPRECENINEREHRLRQHEAKTPSRPASSTRPTIFDAISDIVQLAFSSSIVSRRFARRAHPFITACAAGDVPCLLALFQLELYATQPTCAYIPAPQAASAPPSNRASQNQFEPRLHVSQTSVSPSACLMSPMRRRVFWKWGNSKVVGATGDAGRRIRMRDHRGHW